MPKMIVSANYLDRDSVDRWLVRGSNERVSKVRPARMIHATGVRFVQSEYERGFGCHIVARCKTATIVDSLSLPQGAVELRFALWGFQDPNQKEVLACSELFLGEDGSVRAVLNPVAATLGQRIRELVGA